MPATRTQQIVFLIPERRRMEISICHMPDCFDWMQNYLLKS